MKYPHQNDSKSHPLVAVGGDIEENIGSISFRTDTNTLGYAIVKSWREVFLLFYY
jgi:hypothetical protein